MEPWQLKERVPMMEQSNSEIIDKPSFVMHRYFRIIYRMLQRYQKLQRSI